MLFSSIRVLASNIIVIAIAAMNHKGIEKVSARSVSATNWPVPISIRLQMNSTGLMQSVNTSKVFWYKGSQNSIHSPSL
jgi:hypothetical protein